MGIYGGINGDGFSTRFYSEEGDTYEQGELGGSCPYIPIEEGNFFLTPTETDKAVLMGLTVGDTTETFWFPKAGLVFKNTHFKSLWWEAAARKKAIETYQNRKKVLPVSID